MSLEVLKSHFVNGVAARRAGSELPLALVIDGQAYPVIELPEDGGAIVEFDGHAEPHQSMPSTLVAVFDGFEISVPALWEVVSYQRNRLSIRLAPVNEANHLATITTLMQAIRSGDWLDASDMMDIARLTGSNSAAAVAPPAPRGLRQRVGTVAFSLLALALLAFIVTNLLIRAYVVSADGTIESVRQTTLTMPEDARLVAYRTEAGTAVKPGTPVATVRTLSGQLLSINSQCDCIVGEQPVAENALVRRGDAVVKLIPAGTTSRALLSVPLDDLRGVRVGDRVTARFYNSDARVSGRIERVVPPRVVAQGPALPTSYSGKVEVRLADQLPAWRVGQAISANIILSRLNPFD